MSALPALSAGPGIASLGLSRATVYRHRPKVRRVTTRTPPLKLDSAEQAIVLDVAATWSAGY